MPSPKAVKSVPTVSTVRSRRHGLMNGLFWLLIVSVARDFHNCGRIQLQPIVCLRCVHDSREAPLSVGTCRTYHISSGQPIVRTWRWCELHWRGGLCNASNYSILAVKQISQSQPEHSLPDEFRLGHGLDQSVQLKTSCFSFPGQGCTSPEVCLQERTKGSLSFGAWQGRVR